MTAIHEIRLDLWKDELANYAKRMAKWMHEWMDIINTADDIIEESGMVSNNFQAKKGFQINFREKGLRVPEYSLKTNQS